MINTPLKYVFLDCNIEGNKSQQKRHLIELKALYYRTLMFIFYKIPCNFLVGTK